MSDIPTTREIEALVSSAFQRARAEKAEAKLAALKVSDARRTVALAGAEDWAREASRRMGIDFPGVGLALHDYSEEIVAAARKRLEETDERS